LRNSSTSPKRERQRPRSHLWLCAVLVFVCCAHPANALGPNKSISQYIRDKWGVDQGFPGGPVYAIAQTPDGYLWIGGEQGLVRFDGISFGLIESADPTIPGFGPVLGLAVDAEGYLWVRLEDARLLRYRDGKFENVFPSFKLAESHLTAMCVGKNGDILFSGLENGTFRYSNGKFANLSPTGEAPTLILSAAETADGTVWLGTREQGLYYLIGGRAIPVVRGLPDKKINTLLAIDSRELWVGTDNGIVRWDGNALSASGIPAALARVQALVMTRDRDSNIWVGTSTGLMRIDNKGLQRDAGAPVTALFEDREGNLWVGTSQGIERLRDSTFTTYSVSAGLPSDSNGPIYADGDGRMWFAPLHGGLYWSKKGKAGQVTSAGLDKDVVYSIAGSSRELWIGRQRGGLTRLLSEGDSFSAETFMHAQGLAEDSVFAVYESRDGTVWAGTINRGLSALRNGSFKTYTTADGLASNSISAILEGRDGTMWFGTPNGLSAFAKGNWRTFTSEDGLPPGNVNCILQDSGNVLWVGTANGLAFLSSGRIQTPVNAPESLREPIFGMEEDRKGSLWIATANRIVRADREKILSHELQMGDVREYGSGDGLLSTQGVRRQRSVVGDSQGGIWFSTSRGLSFVDVTSMRFFSAPALVHVNGISADGRLINLAQGVRIPPPHQRITLSYSGLILSVPERVRFMYRLDGFDQAWTEPTTAREAIYTNLDAGSYLFHVIASNSDGEWNSSEATLRFAIAPMFWQTWWFRLAALLAFAIAILAYIRLRVVRLTQRLNLRFEERLSERTRIAQELHDTLLQGFLSASMQLQVADDRLPADSSAKAMVGRVLELMRQVIDESRNVVRGLRSPKQNLQTLEEAFSQVRQEFPMKPETEFRIIVEGAPRALRPIIRDEVYLIGHEALSNAFRHSQASEIEVELEYAAGHLRVLVRDNGGGIDPHVLRLGRDGHYGLSGMKARSERIGGHLSVLSRAAAGTEVELVVPGEVAFEQKGSDLGGWFFRLKGKKRNEDARPGSGPTP
jgi:ligand-binding sensor domain-containing protein/signal transduction histidine kinase